MSIDFATEAVKRGCPYVAASSATEIKFEYQPDGESGSFSWVRPTTHPYRRAIIGWVLYGWWKGYFHQMAAKRDFKEMTFANKMMVQAEDFTVERLP